ncbi:hypothetical protein EJB05_27596 [Eragrostis curvula]|uniref:DUF4378 domain-containing protein n=1 Tax=Eragrostis curvula TaxID=38414 RepID=A0A5J9UNT2_9POAL|nr:hypothetical protein EJB05_27596 [Eragrostis curvula]
MVAMASGDEMMEDERPVHQGCMAGFLHLFDRPQILSGRRLHHTPRRLMSSSSGSATPSERSMQLDRATPAPSSPDMTPPAAPRPSLQLPPLHDLKDAAGSASGAPSWRLPRLSLDSRAVVDGRGKYRPREIRAPSPANAPPSPSLNGDERRSPSVVARLMGLDALPHGQDAEDGGGGGGQREQQQYACPAAALRRSASERVPRDPSSHFRFVDPAFFERPSSPVPQQQYQRPAPSPVTSYPAAAAESAAMRRAPAADPAGVRGGGIQRRSRFDAREVFPDPAKRDPAAAHGGEIALYGEIERRLRKRGIAEPARDLETLKQILEALQLKGLLHHAPPPPQPQVARTPPPIVVMRPSHRALSQQPSPASPASRLTPARRLRVDVDRARRPRSPDPSASPARSPASPARRGGPQSPQRRVSPAQSPKQEPPPFRRPSTADAAGVRSRIGRRAAHNSAMLFPDEEASTTFSDGGSSSSFSASSRWDFEPPPAVRGDEPSRAVLERCGKLLSSIQAFTGGDAVGADQQPSPVSVLDAAAFLADEDSPSSSSGSKRVIDFNIVRSPKKPVPTVSDPEDDEWALGGSWPTTTMSSGPNAGDPDYAYVAQLVRLFHRKRDPADVYKIAEQRRLHSGCAAGGDTWQHHRRLLCGAVAEALERQRCACPWDPAAWLRGAELVDHVWAEVRRAREKSVAPAEEEQELDLNDVTCDAIRRDLAAADGAWASTLQQQQPGRLGAEVADAVLQIERLVFKDLVADTIRELADANRLMPPRRKLVF